MEEHGYNRRDDLDKSIDLIRPNLINESSISFQELKNEYVKALNYIDIVILEKNNLMNTMKLVSNKKQETIPQYRSLSSSKSSSQLKEVLSMDKKLVHLEHENRELKKLLEENKKTQSDKRAAMMEREVENLKGILEEKTAKIAFLQKETRVQQEKITDNYQLEKHVKQLNNEIDLLNREVEAYVVKVQQLEEENAKLIADHPDFSPFAQETSQAITKYATYTLDTVNRFPLSHYIRTCFDERFSGSAELHRHLNAKDYATLLIKNYKYINDLIYNITSTPQAPEQPLSSRGTKTEKIEKPETPNRPKNIQPISTKRIIPQGERANTPSTSLNSSMALGSASTTRKVGAQLLANGPILATEKKKENKPILKGHNRNLSQQSTKARTPADSALLETSATPYQRQPRSANLVTEEVRSGKDSFIRYESAKVNQTVGGDGERIKLKNLTSLGQARDLRNEHYEELKERNFKKSMKSPEKEVVSADHLAEKERQLREKERKLLEMERELREKELRTMDRSISVNKDNNNSRYPGSMTFKGESKESQESKNSNLYIPLREAERDNEVSRFNDSRYVEIERIPSRLTPMARETEQSRNRDYIDESKGNMRRGDSIKDDSTRRSESRGVLHDFDPVLREEQRSFTQKNPKRDRYDDGPYEERCSPLLQTQDFRGKGTKSPMRRERIDQWESHEKEYQTTGRDHHIQRKVPEEVAYHPHTLPRPQQVDRLEDLNSHIRFRNDDGFSPISNIDYSYKNPDGFGDYERFEDPHNKQMTFENQEYDGEENYYEQASYTGRDDILGYTNKNRGTDFPTFKVVFGRTESKHKPNSSSPDNKNNSSIIDASRRKKVSHVFQTYDVIRGEEKKNKAIISKENPQYEIQPVTPMNCSIRIPEASSTKSGDTTPTKARKGQIKE